MSSDVFISFASEDFKTARTICNAIESRGFKCWIASRDIRPGENFQSAIVHAIRESKALLLVFTANSNRSDEMTKELALASQHKLMVVPLRVENVNPSDAFAYEFATRQWIDLFADWEVAINQLCERLSAALADDRSHVDTIVLGKPSLQDPKVVQKLVAAKRRSLALGLGTVVLVGAIAGLLVPRLLTKPIAPADASSDGRPAHVASGRPADGGATSNGPAPSIVAAQAAVTPKDSTPPRLALSQPAEEAAGSAPTASTPGSRPHPRKTSTGKSTSSLPY
jgi:TIR domain